MPEYPVNTSYSIADSLKQNSLSLRHPIFIQFIELKNMDWDLLSVLLCAGGYEVTDGINSQRELTGRIL